MLKFVAGLTQRFEILIWIIPWFPVLYVFTMVNVKSFLVIQAMTAFPAITLHDFKPFALPAGIE